jgi:TRAP-type C4-dicarboxylate transport system permease small subunit
VGPDQHATGGPGQTASDPLRRPYDVLGYLAGLMLAIMTGAVFVQVVLRFLGRAGFDGLDEVPRYLFVWLVMIGAAAAMQRGEHTVLDYFINRLGTRTRAAVIALTNAVAIALFVYLIKLSLVLVPNAQFQSSPGLQLPLGYVYVAIPIGSALLVLPMVRNVFRALSTLWQRPS